MARLFRVDYIQDQDSYTYLTVGEDYDTDEDITSREYEKFTDKSCMYYFEASEVKNVDGYNIIVED